MEKGNKVNPESEKPATEIAEERKDETVQLSGEEPIDDRIGQLEKSITNARIAFKKASDKLLIQISLYSGICLVIIVGAFYYAKDYLLNPDKVILHDTWTWQIIYYTAIRLAVVAAIFSFATYCFRLLSSHIQMYQENENKRAVIDALPGFVESGVDREKRAIIFNKLIEMVVGFDETGIISKDSQLKTSNDVLLKLVELLMKGTKTKD
jgi:hypothetical protein